MMGQVKFTQMKDGTKEDYLLLAELEKPHLGMTADRVLEEMERHGQASLEGYRINRCNMGCNPPPAPRPMGLISTGSWGLCCMISATGLRRKTMIVFPPR